MVNAPVSPFGTRVCDADGHTWQKHAIPTEVMQKWQNKLPLYNLRRSNLSAAIIRPQLPQTPAMLMRACDVRLPARLTLDKCDVIADVLLDAAQRAASAKDA